MNPNENVWLKRSVARVSVCVWGLRMDGSSKSTRNVVCAAKSNQSVSNADGTWRIERISFLSYLFFLVVRLQRWCMSFKYSWIISLPCDLDWPNINALAESVRNFLQRHQLIEYTYSSSHHIDLHNNHAFYYYYCSSSLKPTCQRLRFIGDMRVYVVRYW